VWLAGALAATAWLVWVGRAGMALVFVAAIAPLVILSMGRRSVGLGGRWLTCALAPLLGAVGLAGAFPAIAGQAARWLQRALLGAVGFWWLTLAEPALGRYLWLGQPPGTPARAVWEDSATSAGVHVLAPMLGLGVLLGGALWAAGSVVLPWVVRGRHAALDVVAATVWSAALVAVVPLTERGSSVHAAPRGAVLGAVLGGMLAVAARALRGPV
jgi:hypothetical protein